MIKPVRNARITSDYGPRTRPYEGFHQGIDFGRVNDLDVLAADDGVVKLARWQTNRKGFGKYIIIQHNGYCTVYAHLAAFNVKRGQRVSKGQLIATMGNTGNSFGVHLHFGVFNCMYSNFFKKGPNGFKYAIKPVFEKEVTDYKRLYEECKTKLDKIGAIL